MFPPQPPARPAAGAATFTVKSLKAATHTVTVMVGATTITNSLTITFNAPGTGNVFTWDPSHTPATASDGTGTWDTTLANWANGGADFAWPNNGNDSAVLGTGATLAANTGITLGAPITIGNLNFNTGATSTSPQYQITRQHPDLCGHARGQRSRLCLDWQHHRRQWVFPKTGAGTLRMTGNSTNYTGDIAVSAGILQLGNRDTASEKSGTGNINLSSSGSFTVRRAAATTVSNTIAGISAVVLVFR